MGVADILFRAVQRGRERHSPPVVNAAVFRWPTPSPSPPGLVVEELEYYVEEGPQGWVPLRIVRPDEDAHDDRQTPPPPAEPPPPADPPPPVQLPPSRPPSQLRQQPQQQSQPSEAAAEGGPEEGPGKGSEAPELQGAVRRPVVIFMHATGETMDVVRPKQELYARMGYFTAAIDARYHGQRAALPYEVGVALNAVAPKVLTAAAAAPGAAAGGSETAAAASLVTTVKGLSPKVLAALERADAAAGLAPPPPPAAAAAGPVVPPPEPSVTSLLASPTMARSATTRLSAPVGSRTAAAEARVEAEARERMLAHERFIQAWLGVVSEFRDRRSTEATTAVLATAPPPPPPPAQAAATTAAAVPTSSGDGSSAAAEAAAPPPRWALTHGHRGAAVARSDKVTARNVYELALAAAWRGSGEQPLFLDTVWDLVLLLDVLAMRPEVDMTRVGVTGFSMGGTITWLLAVIDPRVAVAAPSSGVQGFCWAVDNEQYHARVGRYPLVFEIAASDLRGTKTAEVDGEVVTAVWNKLLPGIMSVYDAHMSLCTIAPRPLLLTTGELDPSCPLPGVALAADSARAVYLDWAKEQRRLQLEAEAEAAAAAAAAAVEAAMAAAAAEAAAAAAAQVEAAAAAAAAAAEMAAAAAVEAAAAAEMQAEFAAAVAAAEAAAEPAAEASSGCVLGDVAPGGGPSSSSMRSTPRATLEGPGPGEAANQERRDTTGVAEKGEAEAEADHERESGVETGAAVESGSRGGAEGSVKSRSQSTTSDGVGSHLGGAADTGAAAATVSCTASGSEAGEALEQLLADAK